jgi:lipopolysaccharide export system permease protein
MHINLYNVLNDARIKDSNKEDSVQRIVAAEYPYTIDLKQVLKKQNVTRKIGEMNYGELIEGAANVAEIFPGVEADKLSEQRMTMLIEASKRLALSIACFAFVLIGVPLGLKSKRKESSIGIGISFGVVFVFYLFLIIATNLKGYPQYRPDLILWIPVIAAQVLGFWLIQRAN